MASTKLNGRSRRRRGEEPFVAVYIKGPSRGDSDITPVLVEEAGRRGWRLRDLSLTDGFMPPDHKPVAALMTLLPSDPLVKRLQSMRCPVVRLGRLEHPDDDTLPVVLPDYALAGRVIADYFAHRGFRELAMAAHQLQQIVNPVEQGLRQRAGELGCRCHMRRFTSEGAEAVEDQYQRARESTAWLKTLPRPLALFTGQVFLAAQICQMGRDVGLSVPEDLAVMAWGISSVSYEMVPEPISSIGADGPAMTRRAFQLLDDLLHGRAVPARTFVPPRGVITRRSTDMVAVGDPLVARAVRYIWDHLDQNLSVDDIAAEIKTPRYRLEQAFSAHLGRGIAAELRRVRIETLCRLLTSTDLPISDLAGRVGFRSSQYLHNVFRRAHGVSPRQFRLKSRAAGQVPDRT